jgi:hypothetical protein
VGRLRDPIRPGQLLRETKAVLTVNVK